MALFTQCLSTMTEKDEGLFMDHITTELNACSLESLPEPILLVTNEKDQATSSRGFWPVMIGCYELQEETNVRKGQLALHFIQAPVPLDSDNASPAKRLKMPLDLKFEKPFLTLPNENMEGEESGILDGKWFPTHNTALRRTCWWYATACASGEIAVYCLSTQDLSSVVEFKKIGSTRIDGCQDNNESVLCLSLNWDYSSFGISFNAETKNEFSTRIVSSYSNGRVAIHNVTLRQGGVEFDETHQWLAHSLFGNIPTQVWTVCVAGKYIFSGGDDCKCKVWDTQDSMTTPIHTVSDFEAGVTVIAPHPTCRDIVAIGSYDESVALYNIKTFTRLFHGSFGGGIWRIQWHPIDRDRLLLAVMHGGCRAVQLSSITDETTSITIESVVEFTKHTSMAYGADWLVSRTADNGNYHEAAASCSFYDKAAYLWQTMEDPS